MSKNRYPIPARTHRVEQEIQRSRFITTVAHAPTIEAARAFIDSIREEFPDATHNCWAFAAGPPGDTAAIGMSDDGEPHGTAGRPMLTALLHGGVGEIAAVVTRYFGGTKLGTGGLVRAYTSSVQQALESLPTRERVDRTTLEVEIDYAHVDALRRIPPTTRPRSRARSTAPPSATGSCSRRRGASLPAGGHGPLARAGGGGGAQ